MLQNVADILNVLEQQAGFEASAFRTPEPLSAPK